MAALNVSIRFFQVSILVLKVSITFFLLSVASLSAFQQLPAYYDADNVFFSFGGTPQTQFSRFPICKNSQRQSPIDINEPISVDPDAKLTISDSWNIPRKQEILFNWGHGPQLIDLRSQPPEYITFKGKTYRYSNRHYHFGSDNNEGSTHALFGKKFPLEVHTEFFEAKYGTIQNAFAHRAILELAQFYQIGDPQPTFEILLNNLRNIVNPNQTVTIPTGVSLASVVPINSKFYWYFGSEDQPGCPEAKIWIIFDQIGTVSAGQMARFRNVLRTYTGALLQKNWRYLQPRNGRQIYVSIPTPSSTNSIEVDEIVNVMSG